ncbi:hypothetical protein IC229_05825 [Spirosoma sp. BT702]|uniref:Uncharacterized protein n=1 Tax=Spirosoma profusum TaxID=2771354 RepID=A0A926XTM3_9BACT|nr:hypothetical protein [Spirosoma profusum]MBD2700144.1 hypothetical protein [Spirosoma profusum]
MGGKRSTVPYYEGEFFDTAILASAGISISLETDRPAQSRSGVPKSGLQPGTTPSVAVPDESLYGPTIDDVMPWGDGNDFPQRMVDLYNQDPIIPQTLGKLATMIVGGGILIVEEDIDEKGQKVFRAPSGDPALLAEIRAFIDHPKFSLYMREMASDVITFYNGWPEMIISKDRSIITSLEPLNGEECRWCRMTSKGELPYIYLSANWPRYTPLLTKKINVLDPYRPDAVEWLREASFHNCVYPIRFPTPGKRYYSLPHHYSIVESGWLDVHLAIPQFKKFVMKNQMTLKYHWKVDKEYWAQTYGEKYTKATPEGKRAIKVKWLKDMNKTLTDVSRAGNSIITDVTWDQVNKVYKDHITVTPITDAMIDGKYIEDNLEAAANIFYAFGVDPSQVGFAGGDKMGGQSGGSDKREAYLIALQMLRPFRDMLLEPLRFVSIYNGWKAAMPKLAFAFNDTILTTLDTGAGTAKKLS